MDFEYSAKEVYGEQHFSVVNNVIPCEIDISSKLTEWSDSAVYMLKLNQISVLVDINPNTGPSNDTLVGMPPYYINDNLAKWAITLDSENGSIDKEGRTTSTLFWQDVGPSPDLMFSGKWLRLRAGSNFGASFSSLEHWGKWFVTNNSKLKFGFMLTEGGSYVAPSVVNPAIPRVKNIQVLNSSHVATYGYVMNFSIVKIPKFKYTR